MKHIPAPYHLASESAKKIIHIERMESILLNILKLFSIRK